MTTMLDLYGQMFSIELAKVLKTLQSNSNLFQEHHIDLRPDIPCSGRQSRLIIGHLALIIGMDAKGILT